MPVRINSRAVADPERREMLTDTALQALGSRAGNWTVSVAEAPDTHDWEITIEGPENFKASQRFHGSAEHRPEFILKRIREALPARA